MCASPYSGDFEDSYSIIHSTSLPIIPGRRGVGGVGGIGSINSGGGDHHRNNDEGDRTSIHSIILDSGEKSWRDFRLQEWIHLIVSFLTNFGYLTFMAFLMYKYETNSDHYVFSALIVIKFVFTNFFLFHGIFKEQPFQILMQLMTIISLWTLDLIYYLSDISNPPETSDTDGHVDKIGFELMLFYLRSILCLLNLLTGITITWKYWSIEQAIFKTVGTDVRRVMVFRNLFLGFSLLFFDVETSLVSLLLFLRNGFPSMLLHEILVLIGGVIFLIIWAILGYKSMRSEGRAMTWAFVLVSCVQPAYLIVLFVRNIKWTGSSQLVLTASSHYMSFVALTVHLSVVAAVIVASHYHGNGYGDALVNGIHVSIKNSAEYEELRRILFHPINPRGSIHRYRQPEPNTSSRTVLLNAEVY